MKIYLVRASYNFITVGLSKLSWQIVWETQLRKKKQSDNKPLQIHHPFPKPNLLHLWQFHQVPQGLKIIKMLCEIMDI